MGAMLRANAEQAIEPGMRGKGSVQEEAMRASSGAGEGGVGQVRAVAAVAEGDEAALHPADVDDAVLDDGVPVAVVVGAGTVAGGLGADGPVRHGGEGEAARGGEAGAGGEGREVEH